ncbi:hypothetical protein [Thermoplasma volcanium GSS1]|uniref:Protein TV1384 n=1 Tax=Thermoplasma volcanium (strain ATCC 51530 / DSM 4299 / JCM 9571 / NBRC 15438 / GSS1) TaxID=273116 RepID=Y1384_THEVO|nr:TIGR00296 family protein [Thermoplasma volcanium]Q978N1.1 RecName: Full=Protein TV1384 [Thermoplasma volcanium GSS1]BAB60526.1 hypothetical protein [Thermoplasma volcanium GSS1]
MDSEQINVNLDIGAKAVMLARRAAAAKLNNEKLPEVPDDPIFHEKHGVFTTINTYPDNQLRGCIGFPEPYYELGEGIIKSSIYAATDDPRFDPMEPDELNRVTFELSILTVPQEVTVNPEERPKAITVGKDGIIAVYNGASGLLLPQVATEYRMSAEEFLEALCEKAGLWQGCWKYKKVKISKFQAIVFGEIEPNGKVEQR